MDLESARDDLYVAAVASGSAVAATLLLVAFDADASLLVRSLPLFVYFLYLFTRKGGPYTDYDTPRNWAVLSVASAVGVVGYGLFVV
jgi:hypothetical protein